MKLSTGLHRLDNKRNNYNNKNDCRKGAFPVAIVFFVLPTPNSSCTPTDLLLKTKVIINCNIRRWKFQ